jgi:hypothetical protein
MHNKDYLLKNTIGINERWWLLSPIGSPAVAFWFVVIVVHPSRTGSVAGCSEQ